MRSSRIFWVGQFRIKAGMDAEAVQWWREKGSPDILAEPCTKLLSVYAVQFALGGKYNVEIWQEMEDLAALDKKDGDPQAGPELYFQKLRHLQEAAGFLEWGPARLMTDWPESFQESGGRSDRPGDGPYWVGQFRIHSGMDVEAAEWWRDRGLPDILGESCTKTVSAYAVPFALGGDSTVEVWQEIEDYAALDRVAIDFQTQIEFYANQMKHLAEAHTILDWGPARLMKKWPIP